MGKMQIFRVWARNQSENTRCCRFWQNLKLYACQLLLTFKNNFPWGYYLTILSGTYQVLPCHNVELAFQWILLQKKNDVAYRYSLCIQVVVCSCSVKVSTVQGQCALLELSIIYQNCTFCVKLDAVGDGWDICFTFMQQQILVHCIPFMMIKLLFGMFAIN